MGLVPLRAHYGRFYGPRPITWAALMAVNIPNDDIAKNLGHIMGDLYGSEGIE